MNLFYLQLAKTGNMVRIVLVFAPKTAGLVHPLTAHVVVMLVGENLTVVLVSFYIFQSKKIILYS